MSAYSKLYRRVLWPGYEKLRGRHTHQLLAEAEVRQWWAADKLRDWQRQELAALLRHAGENCPWYQLHLAEKPILTKAIIRAHRADLLAKNYQTKVFVHKTGGSTGEPLSFYLTRESYEWRNAMMLRGYGWAGAHEGVKQFFLWSVAAGTQSRLTQWKTAIHDRSMRRMFFNNFRLSRATLPACLAALNQFAPVVLVGYTSMLEYLARYIQKQGGLRVKLRSVITAAEGINDAQRQLFQEVFQVPIFASYGSREFKLIAMECDRGGLHLSADNLSIEVLRNGQPAQPGELGQLIITDLHNYGMPFIRYEIGDLATARADTCPCGRGLPLLGAVHGRIPDTIQTPDGKLISGIFFPHLLKEFDWIQQFQAIQKELDHVQLNLVVQDERAAEQGVPELRREVLAVLGAAVRLEVQFVADIPRTATGKHRSVISEIPVTI
ncbi:MAG: phenylacetate--CoA ligase family protein [Verrucomicrobiota bacterium]